MVKLLVSIFVIVFLCSCGVDTSSNQVGVVPDSGTNTSTTGTSLDLIDPNPINTDSNTVDDNNTTPDTNGTDTGGPTPGSVSDFDTTNAIYDANACNAISYTTASDASYNGINVGENGSSFFSIKGQGLEIRSEHLEADSINSYKTWITLFYKSFPGAEMNSLGLQGYTSYLMNGLFYISYDIAWSDQSIGGINRTMYIQSNKNTTLEKDSKLTCYRLILNSVVGTRIDVKKVYRYR